VLRALLIVLVIVIGGAAALRRPFHALLFYIWIAYFRPEAWLWYDFVTQLNLSLIAGIILLLTAVLHGTRFRLDLRTLLLFLFLAHNVASGVLSPHYSEIFSSLESFAKTIVVAYMIISLVTTQERIRVTIIVMALSLGFEAVKQGWVQLLTNPGGVNSNSVPFLGDNNAVAVGMLMLIPLVWGLANTSTRRWERYAYNFMAIGVAYRAIATYSRGGFLAAGALALVLAWRSRRRMATLAGVTVVGVVVLSAMPESFWGRMSTITVQSDDEDGRDRSAAGRLHFWQVARLMAADHPMFGVGHSAYNVTYDKYDFSEGYYGSSRSVHSSWFGILAELGYVGLLLAGLNLALALMGCWRVRRMVRRGECRAGMLPLATALEAGLVAYAVGGAFVPMQYNEMAWHFIALSGALLAVAERQRAEQSMDLQPISVVGRPGHLYSNLSRPEQSAQGGLR
jgi:probable O-glycosylation ligase (exosortase A-associated)